MITALMCLALNVYFEARGEGQAGQMAVAHVVMNRVADKRWPNTVCEVVYQDDQFSWTADPTVDGKDIPALRRAQRVAEHVLEGSYDTTRGSTHYHNISVAPSWATRLTQTLRIGNHVFYR